MKKELKSGILSADKSADCRRGYCNRGSMQYEIISKSGKNDIFRCKNVTFFLFLLKDRLWVLVRTASLRRF